MDILTVMVLFALALMTGLCRHACAWQGRCLSLGPQRAQVQRMALDTTPCTDMAARRLVALATAPTVGPALPMMGLSALLAVRR